MVRSLLAVLLVTAGLHAQTIEIGPELPIAEPVIGFGPGEFAGAKIVAGRHGFFAVWIADGGVVGAHLDRAGNLLDPVPLRIANGDGLYAVAPFGDSYVVATHSPPRLKLTEIGTGRSREWASDDLTNVHALALAASGDRLMAVWTDVYVGADVWAAMFDQDLELAAAPVWIGSQDTFGRVSAGSAGDGFLAAGAYALVLLSRDGEVRARRRVDGTIEAADGGALLVNRFAGGIGRLSLEMLNASGEAVRSADLGVWRPVTFQWTGTRFVIGSPSWPSDGSVEVLSLDVRLRTRDVFRASPMRPQYAQRPNAFPPVPGAIVRHGSTTLLLWNSPDALHTSVIEPLQVAPPQLLSRGIPDQRVQAAAWAGGVLGIVWTQRECEVWFGRLDVEGRPLDGPGILVSTGDKATIATNGRAFAVAWRDGTRFRVQIFGADGFATPAIDLGEYRNGYRAPLVASDGDRFLVAWYEGQMISRVIDEHGVAGPELPGAYGEPVALAGMRGRYAVALDGNTVVILDAGGAELRRTDVRLGSWRGLECFLASSAHQVLVIESSSFGLSGATLLDYEGNVVAERAESLHDTVHSAHAVGWDGSSFIMTDYDGQIRVSRLAVVNGELVERDATSEPLAYPQGVSEERGAAGRGHAAIFYMIDRNDPSSWPVVPASFVRILNVPGGRGRAVRH